jgi:hypothetical protein
MSDGSSLSLPYESPPTSSLASILVRVQPDGVILRVSNPSCLTELAKVLVSLAAAALFGSILVMLAANVVENWGRRVQFTVVPAAALALGGCVVCVAELAAAVRALWRMARRDPLVGTRFFPSADQPPGAGVDPVRSVEVKRDLNQLATTRAYMLKVVTAKGKKFECFRGRTTEEVEHVVDELTVLLRLDAAPTGGFPVTRVAR